MVDKMSDQKAPPRPHVANFKIKPFECLEYIKFIKTLDCCICTGGKFQLKSPGTPQTLPHHTDGPKEDLSALPVCDYHHAGPEGEHTLGKETFEKTHGLVVRRLVELCLREYIRCLMTGGQYVPGLG